jgi:hypothetical protein
MPTSSEEGFINVELYVPGSTRSGTAVSPSTIALLDKPVYDDVKQDLEKGLKPKSRSKAVENGSITQPEKDRDEEPTLATISYSWDKIGNKLTIERLSHRYARLDDDDSSNHNPSVCGTLTYLSAASTVPTI